LRSIRLIKGDIDGLKINYCINCDKVKEYLRLFDGFFREIKKADIKC
jgi:hypothetical protein